MSMYQFVNLRGCIDIVLLPISESMSTFLLPQKKLHSKLMPMGCLLCNVMTVMISCTS